MKRIGPYRYSTRYGSGECNDDVAIIVSRILRELNELAEHDGDAELVDALDVAMPASSNGRCD